MTMWPAERMLARLPYGSARKRPREYDPPSVELTRRAVEEHLQSSLTLSDIDSMPFLFTFDHEHNPKYNNLTFGDCNRETWRNLKPEQRSDHMRSILNCCLEQVRDLDDRVLGQYIQERKLATLIAAIIFIAVKSFNCHDVSFYPAAVSILMKSFNVYDRLYSDYWFRPAFQNVGDVVHGPLREQGSAAHHPQLRKHTGVKSAHPIQCELNRTLERVVQWSQYMVDEYKATSGPDRPWSVFDDVIIGSDLYKNGGEIASKDEFTKSSVAEVAMLLLFPSDEFKFPCHATQRESGELGTQVL